ncbi:4-Cys prefix domain-containing protein [Scytonema sp. UIC 10036]|uniref:4-Cys prefix domain-containing protein n=1 Tax=Scytonema sp. UIC 10036 TaxID=2304196 RepID=UPI00325A6350
MLYCLNPNCPHPENNDGNRYCQSCQTPLIPQLRNRYRIIKVLSTEGGFSQTFLAEDVDKLVDLSPQLKLGDSLRFSAVFLSFPTVTRMVLF